MLINDARQAVREEAPLDRLRALTQDLQQVLYSLGAPQVVPAGDRAGTGPGGDGRSGRESAEAHADDVIDAEFTAG
jgi:molecular chaperone DnaK